MKLNNLNSSYLIALMFILSLTLVSASRAETHPAALSFRYESMKIVTFDDETFNSLIENEYEACWAASRPGFTECSEATKPLTEEIEQ